MKLFCIIITLLLFNSAWSSENLSFAKKLKQTYEKKFEELKLPDNEADFISQLPKFFNVKELTFEKNWIFYDNKGGSGTAPYFGGVIYHQGDYHLISLRLNSSVIEIIKLGNPKAFYFHAGIIYIVHLNKENNPIISGISVSDCGGDYHGTDGRYPNWR